MATVAEKVILPEKGVFRTVFLYVGQGEATIMAVPDGDQHRIVLVDCHEDAEFGGVRLCRLLKDLGKISLFINTHPHQDHLAGIEEISKQVGIQEVWHSGHVPGKDHREAYDELKKVIDSLPKDKVVTLEGTKEEKKLGDVFYNVLSPAEYVVDEIEDEDAETRYRRIHEQCAVLRFTYGEARSGVLITGDSNLAAWQKHITNYHTERLPSTVLSASHHGSRSFFMDNEGDDPYLDHLKAISPDYIVVSAPKRSESPHGHPHEDAMKLYKEELESADSLFHLGKNRECVIVDIRSNGEIEVSTDKELVDEYGGDDGSDPGKGSRKAAVMVRTSLDKKPMGC